MQETRPDPIYLHLTLVIYSELSYEQAELQDDSLQESEYNYHMDDGLSL